MYSADPMECPEKPGLLEARKAVAALVGMRSDEMAAAGDAALVETDFSRLGCSSMDALRQLLAVPTDLPIVVTFAAASGRGPDLAPGVRTMVRKPGNAAEFRGAVNSMRNACDQMYLSIGV